MNGSEKIIIIGGSAGSFEIVHYLLSQLPGNLPVALVLCLHRLKYYRKGFAEALSSTSKIMVTEPDDKEPIEPGRAYVAPSNYHLLIDKKGYFSLSIDEEVNFSRPSIDLILESAALVYKNNLTGIILSGANSDGAYGMSVCQQMGGHTIVQDTHEAQFSIMPESVLQKIRPDKICSTEKILEYLRTLKL